MAELIYFSDELAQLCKKFSSIEQMLALGTSSLLHESLSLSFSVLDRAVETAWCYENLMQKISCLYCIFNGSHADSGIIIRMLPPGPQ